MSFNLSITEGLYERAETRHQFHEVVSEAEHASRWYCCYLEWYHQADDLLYDSETTDEEVVRLTEAIGKVLMPPQIAYARDEWFPIPQWRSSVAKYDRAIKRIREALLV